MIFSTPKKNFRGKYIFSGALLYMVISVGKEIPRLTVDRILGLASGRKGAFIDSGAITSTEYGGRLLACWSCKVGFKHNNCPYV